MLILSEFIIEFTLPAPTAMVTLLHLHPSLQSRLHSGNDLHVESLGVPLPPNTMIPTTDYLDSFGNRCARFVAPAGHLRLSGSNIIAADSFPDILYPGAKQMPIEDLPSEVLQFLLPSRYCEVDQFGSIAQDHFGSVKADWERAIAIRDRCTRRSASATTPRVPLRRPWMFSPGESAFAGISSTLPSPSTAA